MPQKRLTPEEKARQELLEKKIKRWGLIIFLIIALGFAANAYYAYIYVPNKAKHSMKQLQNSEKETQPILNH